jgi:hypothetical protein
MIKYRPGPDNQLRPYLWLHLTGLNGRSGDVVGLIDTGADRTSLPADYASLMGYAAGDLQPVQVSQVQGTTNAWLAKRPVGAFVVGAPQITFPIEPLFVDGSLSVLWGRADLLSVFDLHLFEHRQEFAIIPR